MSATERFATVLLPVSRGLHVLRYLSATDMKYPPRVMVVGKPGACDGVSLMFSPGCSANTLNRFEDCVAISAAQPATLMVTTMADPASVSNAVELKVEPLDRKGAEQAEPAAAAPAQPAAVAAEPPSAFQIAGHVQSQGDVTAPKGGWLGREGGKNRVEAFAVAWVESIRGLRLSYGCDMQGRGRHVARVPGQTVGTRGQATAITRVVFEINGSRAEQYELVVSAAFAGSAARSATGRRIELCGPSGNEPLVGLKVDIREAVKAAEPAPAIERAVGLRPSVPERGRVRVFRAGAAAAAAF